MNNETTTTLKANSGRARGAIPIASDSYFPNDFELNVKVGDKVVAGKTILARKKAEA